MTATLDTTLATEPAEVRPPRQRNRRGEGARLRDEIIVGATAVLERTGSEDAVTLRAIAREVGIAAPSIARHFKDQAEIIDAVVAKEGEALLQGIFEAAASTAEPLERIYAMCRAYVDYGFKHPSRYGLVIGRRFLPVWDVEERVMEESGPVLSAGVDLVRDSVQACIDSGASAATDAFLTTAVLWFALHGFVTVTQAITSVEWPEREVLLTACVERALQLTQPSSKPASGAKKPVRTRQHKA